MGTSDLPDIITMGNESFSLINYAIKAAHYSYQLKQSVSKLQTPNASSSICTSAFLILLKHTHTHTHPEPALISTYADSF